MSAEFDNFATPTGSRSLVSIIGETLRRALVGELTRIPVFYALFLSWLGVTVIATFVFGDTLFMSVKVYARRFYVLAGPMIGLFSGALLLYAVVNRGDGGMTAALTSYVRRVKEDSKVTRVTAAIVTYVLFMACFHTTD